jgi:hypothetical protein
MWRTRKRDYVSRGCACPTPTAPRFALVAAWMRTRAAVRRATPLPLQGVREDLLTTLGTRLTRERIGMK